MTKKYEFTGETKKFDGVILRRIRALIDIPLHGVKAGDLGGWLEAEHNLSHAESAWVEGEACVSGYGRVYGYGRVSDNGRVYDHGQVYGSGWVRNNGRATRAVVALTGFPHTVTISDHHVAVGCEMHPPSAWAERGAAIIRADGHTAEEAKAWAAIINQLAAAHGCTDLTEDAQ